jgi:hypothetical protein
VSRERCTENARAHTLTQNNSVANSFDFLPPRKPGCYKQKEKNKFTVSLDLESFDNMLLMMYIAMYVFATKEK